jgi:hypothetical protein
MNFARCVVGAASMSRPESEAVVSLGPWDQAARRAVRRADPKVLLAQPAQIAKLSDLEACHVIKQLGVEDAVPLLAHATPDHTRTLFDLEGWSTHALQPDDLLSWLAGYREAGLDALVAAVRAWGREAMAAFLARRLHIAVKPDDDTPPDEVPDWLKQSDDDLELFTTPDDRMLVAARLEDAETDEPVDEDERQSVVRLVADLYRDEGWDEIAGLLRMAMTDDRIDLEETALRFRTGRLEDLGFPPPERARAIYALRDEAPPPPERTLQPTTVALASAYVPPDDGGLFVRALRRIADPRVVQRIESELVPVSNAVLVADRMPWSDPEAVAAAVRKVIGFVQIGLGEEDAVDEAAGRLAAQPLRVWFELGHTRAARLGQRLRKLAARGPFQLGEDPWALLEAPERDAAQALAHRDLSFPRVLEAGGGTSTEAASSEALDVAGIGERRVWRTAQDVRAAEALLAHLEAWAEAEAALGLGAALQGLDEGVLPEAPQERTLRAALTTALSRAWLGGAFEPAPLTGAELRDLADLAGPPRDDAAPALAGTEAVLEALGGRLPAPAAEAARREGAWGLARAAESLAPFAGGQPDPRFVEGLLVRPDPGDDGA